MRKRKVVEENYRSIFTDDGVTMRFRIDQTKPFVPMKNPDLLDISLNTLCYANCKFCVREGSLVETLNGPKPIEKLEIGELVYTFNEHTQQRELNPIDQLHAPDYCGDVIVIELENGNVLEITANHEVYTQRGKVKAGELKATDEIITF